MIEQWDQGQPSSYGFVTFSPNKDIAVMAGSNTSTLNVLKSLFGEENIIIAANNRGVFRGYQTEFIAEVNKFPNKLRVDENGQTMRFNYEQMPWMHEQLDIEMPKTNRILLFHLVTYLIMIYHLIIRLLILIHTHPFLQAYRT